MNTVDSHNMKSEGEQRRILVIGSPGSGNRCSNENNVIRDISDFIMST